jgi:hypothetical protein
MNKKYYITVLITTLMSMVGVSSRAHDVEASNFNGVTIYYVWTNNNTELAVSCRGTYSTDYYDDYSGAVTIPEFVEYNGNMYSVTSIANSAFEYCSGLTSVTIPNSVTDIGKYAFGECSSLTSVSIPNSVTSIGRWAFSGCTALSSLTIPNSVTTIDRGAFVACAGLASIIVADDNPIYDSRDNCNAIIETTTNTLVAGCMNTLIPNSVTSIGEFAFTEHSSLTEICIPNSVSMIGERAFYGCISLNKLIIPQSVSFIGDFSLGWCSGLKEIIVEDDNPIYDSRDNCNAIIETSTNTLIAGCMNTIIPQSVSSIRSYAFYYCESLTSCTIPNSVTFIDEFAFGDCYNLTTVVIPNSLNFIGLLAFDRCDKLFNLYCYAEYPPTIDYSLGEIDLSKITLHVPAALIDIYKNAIEWQNFGNIVALTDDDPNPTGIESTKEDKISYPVSTYTIDGKRINKAQRGLNIIKMSDGTTKKVIIK